MPWYIPDLIKIGLLCLLLAGVLTRWITFSEIPLLIEGEIVTHYVVTVGSPRHLPRELRRFVLSRKGLIPPSG